MQTQNYCPKCGSFDIKRKRRGFVRKTILRISPLFRCKKCDNVFSTKKMKQNQWIDGPFTRI